MNPTTKGYSLVFIAVFFLGTQGSIGKFFMNSGIHPIALAAARIILAALFFLIHILLTKPSSLRVQRRHYPFFLFFGTFTVALLHISLNYAVFWSGVGTATILLYTAPSWVTILSIFFFKERPTAGRITALLLTLAGCILIMGSSSDLNINPWGVLFGLSAGFCFALWSVLGRKALDSYSVQVVNFWNLLVGGVVLIALSLLLVPQHAAGINGIGFLGIALMALVNTYIPYNLFVAGMKYISPAKASILSNLELVIAVLLGFFLFGERFTLWKIGGFLAIALGLFLIAREDLLRRKGKLSAA